MANNGLNLNRDILDLIYNIRYSDTDNYNTNDNNNIDYYAPPSASSRYEPLLDYLNIDNGYTGGNKYGQRLGLNINLPDDIYVGTKLDKRRDDGIRLNEIYGNIPALGGRLDIGYKNDIPLHNGKRENRIEFSQNWKF